MVVDQSAALPRWTPGEEPPALTPQALRRAVHQVRSPAHVIQEESTGRVGIGFGGRIDPHNASSQFRHITTLPGLYPEWLGDRGFGEIHGARFPYVGGAMANGIASPEMVVALARAGMMGFLGTAGLSLDEIRDYVTATRSELDGTGLPWGANLIHSPQKPELEMATVDTFFELGVTTASASAFMDLTPAVVRFAATGLRRLHDGTIERRHRLFAKISRPEVAEKFMRPAPDRLLQSLVESNQLTKQEAALAAEVPVAEDLTVESDSGGHTDNRPLSALFPVISRLRDRIQREQNYRRPIRLGAAGGLGTPSAVAAAFSLGAAFVVTGSINQACVEAAQSEAVKEMLADAAFSDVVMAPAGDMFEMGVEVQVLQRGTMFPSRAKKLYDVYSRYDGIEQIPDEVRRQLEDQIFRDDIDAIWQKTRSYFQKNDPDEARRAEEDPKHRLALVCRWYLGLSSKWPLEGNESRRLDYQVWMGPAQGAFNDWVEGSFLEEPAQRQVAQVGLNLMEAAAIITRAQQFRTYGAAVPAEAFDVAPRCLATR